jgi:predicted Ser/Thr protein kinase
MDAESWRQAKSVLEAALLCAPAERDALIAARCADPWLRREVLACLNEHDEDFLESALTISHTFEHATSADDVEAPPDVQPGERIGRYEVVGRLGAGGMGHVFLGNDTELQRKVALKCLIASASAVEIRSRILHEARAAARINHPNIAVVHDVVEHDGRPFLVMEYVEGENLAQALKRERPPLERILAIGRQLASALTAAHGKGIIHRDLKPANIQLMPDGSVKILDFGVAHAISMADMESAGATTTTASVPLSTTMATLRTERGAIRHPGTPAYMSPEQMFGKPIDGRSDIYSLGVILYEMATGHRPYSTDDPLDVVLALSRNLLRPTGAETHLPEAVNDVIGKMLKVEVDQRCQTALEVETAFTMLMTPEPVAVSRSRWKSYLVVAGRAALAVVIAAVCVTTLGCLETSGFNSTMGRSGTPFAAEPASMWIIWGLKSLRAPMVYLLLIFLIFWSAKFLVRMLSLSKHVEDLLNTGMTQTHRLESRLNLQNPTVLGQAVLMIGFVLLVAILWRYWRFVYAFMSPSIDTRTVERYLPLQPRGQPRIDAELYQVWLMALVAGLGAAITRIMRLRSRDSLRRGGSALGLVCAMTAVTLVMCVWPYRIVWQANMPRLDVAGERCYRIGETGEDWLIHCPDREPPRNRVLKRTDPSVRDTGLKQNVFTPRETSRLPKGRL